jgi:hypothetical protein
VVDYPCGQAGGGGGWCYLHKIPQRGAVAGHVGVRRDERQGHVAGLAGCGRERVRVARERETLVRQGGHVLPADTVLYLVHESTQVRVHAQAVHAVQEFSARRSEGCTTGWGEGRRADTGGGGSAAVVEEGNKRTFAAPPCDCSTRAFAGPFGSRSTGNRPDIVGAVVAADVAVAGSSCHVARWDCPRGCA